MREYVKYSLYDRISTRPFLTDIEKRWIAFQVLYALHQCHKVGVSDILFIYLYSIVPILVYVPLKQYDSQDSIVGIATCYWLNDQVVRV